MSGKIVCTGLSFFMCLYLLTSSASLPCSVFIVIIVYLGISEVAYRDRIYKGNSFVGTVKEAIEGLYFSWCLSLLAFLLYYFVCALYLRSLLHGLALPVVKYSSIRVGRSDFFWTVVIISFDCKVTKRS